jgi:hypothetical protein
MGTIRVVAGVGVFGGIAAFVICAYLGVGIRKASVTTTTVRVTAPAPSATTVPPSTTTPAPSMYRRSPRRVPKIQRSHWRRQKRRGSRRRIWPRLLTRTVAQEEASLKVHRSRSVRRVEVTTDGRNLVSHAGRALLCELADCTGLTGAMSVAMADCGISWNTHDPGVVLTQLAVAIADRGDCLSDFEALRSQSELFGDVASVSTAWRAVKATAAPELRQIPRAVAGAREIVWAAAPPGDITIDFDATLVTAFSDKQDARP